MLRRIAKLMEKFFPPKKSFVKEYSLKTILEDISSILKNNCGKLTMFSGYDMTVEEIWRCVQFDGANKGLNKELKVHKK